MRKILRHAHSSGNSIADYVSKKLHRRYGMHTIMSFEKKTPTEILINWLNSISIPDSHIIYNTIARTIREEKLVRSESIEEIINNTHHWLRCEDFSVPPSSRFFTAANRVVSARAIIQFSYGRMLSEDNLDRIKKRLSEGTTDPEDIHDFSDRLLSFYKVRSQTFANFEAAGKEWRELTATALSDRAIHQWCATETAKLAK